MKIFKRIGAFFYAVLMVLLIIMQLLGPKTKKSRKRVIRKIRRKYPDYEIAEVIMQYSDWSSTIRTANEDHKATSAEVVIKNGDRQRTIHLERRFYWMWRIESDAPDHGPDVPEDAYFVEKSVDSVGRRIDIEACVRSAWVIPDENGELYHISGNDDNWCYVYTCVRNLYKTQGGQVYVLNKKTFEWELTELLYSELDYYGNYDPISKEDAEQIIREHQKEDKGDT